MFLSSWLIGLSTALTVSAAAIEKAFIIQLGAETDALSSRSLDQHEYVASTALRPEE
jgi:hypothetical protein